MKKKMLAKFVIVVMVSLLSAAWLPVSAATTGAVELSWIAPDKRIDDSELPKTEIAGYRIYYGTAAGNYTSQIAINSGDTSSHYLELPNDNMYFFGLTTIDTDGRESQLSAEVNIFLDPKVDYVDPKSGVIQVRQVPLQNQAPSPGPQ